MDDVKVLHDISIHALREEGDTRTRQQKWCCTKFLSTPSARRATVTVGRLYRHGQFLSTPSARRATLFAPTAARSSQFLSTPSARRATRLYCRILYETKRFLSTPSARRATTNGFIYSVFVYISIHALREEGDGRRQSLSASTSNFYPRPPRGGRPPELSRLEGHRYFYPRPPRGGRPKGRTPILQTEEFLSTPSARRATKRKDWSTRMELISIHALREEGDSGGRRRFSHFPFYFYPRPPRGGRRASKPSSSRPRIFLSTPSARRATEARCAALGSLEISIHALREEGDLQNSV